jgi:hypothetical protein
MIWIVCVTCVGTQQKRSYDSDGCVTCVGTQQKISVTIGTGHLKVTQRIKLHLQENSMRTDLEANQDPSGIYFKMRLR